MKRILLIYFILIGFVKTQAQTGCDVPGNYCMENGTFNICGGTIFDAGGGNAYPNDPYTMTICPDTPGDVIQLHFSAFALQTSPNGNQSDYIIIYDGPDTSAPSLGNYTGSALQGLDVTGTVNNPTGCLTLVFDPNGAANVSSPGFEAQVSCTTPCDPPTANSSITNPLPDETGLSVSVCLNTPISFSGVGSFAASGFTLANYIWNFDDGTIEDANNQNVTHTFTEPGEYIVTLTVEDNNGCQSLNIIPLQVLVSTIPLFPGVESVTTCFGETVELSGGYESVTWTALPPQVVAGETYLADGAGFSYSTSLTFDFFEDGAVLETCDDLLGIIVNMEHSYMGDLGLFITCPDGTSVDLVDWGTNGGGGTFLGEAVDNESNTPGVGYDYTWSPDATNGTWGENAGGFNTSLPSGTYEAAGNLCDLVGCPLNGEWTFSVTDNLAIDNGYIFYWGLNLNPALFPGVTTFTPIIGVDADSSYWTGPFISTSSADEDVIVIDPPTPGTYEYTYTVVNSFGCSFDTTITVTFEQALAVTAGPDQLYSCGAVELEGSFVGMPTPTCSQDAGTFTYCYGENEFLTWTWCPDNPGDGTAMTLTFNAGSTEFFFDQITIYDGANTSAPILAGGIQGNLAGQSFTATNPSGCLTLVFDSDGSVSCASGSQTEWNYTVGCGNGGPQYTWEWTPTEFLDNPNIPTPDVITLDQTTTFTLVGYPVGHPDCASTDEVIVSIDPLGDPGLDNEIDVCSTDAPFDMFQHILGNPVTTGTWEDPMGNPTDANFDPMSDMPGDYTYNVQFANCSAFSTLTINLAGPTSITISNDTALCYVGDLNLELQGITFGLSPFQYNWDYNGVTIGNTEDMMYNPTEDGVVCLTVTDACDYVVTECLNVTVEQPAMVEFEADATQLCWPGSFVLTNLVDPTAYINSTWTISNGDIVNNDDSYTQSFDNPGVYDVTLQIVSDLGCVYDTTYFDYLTSFAPPTALFDANPQPTDANNTEITFVNQSIGNIIDYYWIFDTLLYLGTSHQPNPVFTFPIGSGGLYPVYLQVTDVNNCTDYFYYTVDINDIFQYYVPNTFTPNNDNINDVFQFYGADIDEERFELMVFNRWGEKVFETKDPSVPWTGNTREGDYYSPAGVYLWRAVVRSKSTGEKVELDGFINLIR